MIYKFFKKNKYFSLFFTLAIFSISTSCQKEGESNVQRIIDDQGVVIATPFLWKTSLHKKEPMSNSHISNQIIYNESIVIPRTNGNNNRSISLVDTKNGNVLWDWDDFYEDHSEYIDVYTHHQYNNLFTFQIGSRSYCINFDNGLTHWKIIRDRSFDGRINSFGQNYFTYGFENKNDEIEDYIAFKGDIQTGSISKFLSANFTYENPDCVRAVLYVIPVPENENLLLVSYAENLPNWITQLYYGLYNIEMEEWIWDKVMINTPQVSNNVWFIPQIVDKKIYSAVTCSIICHNLETGEKLWNRDFQGSFTFTGMIIEDGKLIANCEDCYAYCLDSENGNINWSVRTAGTSSRMSYLNGIVYLVGGSGHSRKICGV